MKRYVLYHKNCMDGTAAAAVFIWGVPGDSEFIPIGYGDELPNFEPGSIVYMLDFSVSPELAFKIQETCELVILDHHQSAYDKYVKFLKDLLPLNGSSTADRVEITSDVLSASIGKLTVLIDKTKSGATLTSTYFGYKPGIFLQLIEDRDLWKFKLNHTQNLHAYLSSIPYDVNEYAEMIGMSEDDLIDEVLVKGKILVKYIASQVDKTCKYARVYDNFLGTGMKAAVVNTSVHWSEVGNLLLEKCPEVDFACSYTDLKNDIRMFSLRSRPGVDVAKIAEKFGGGGHAQAAGFKVEFRKPFTETEYSILEAK